MSTSGCAKGNEEEGDDSIKASHTFKLAANEEHSTTRSCLSEDIRDSSMPECDEYCTKDSTLFDKTARLDKPTGEERSFADLLERSFCVSQNGNAEEHIKQSFHRNEHRHVTKG